MRGLLSEVYKVDGKFMVNTKRAFCTCSWQAIFGVSSRRMNNSFAETKPKQTTTINWEKSVKKATTQQIQELDSHLLNTLMPNPFASRGLNENIYVCPPHLSSFHQLYLHYVWEHIRSCKRYVLLFIEKAVCMILDSAIAL